MPADRQDRAVSLPPSGGMRAALMSGVPGVPSLSRVDKTKVTRRAASRMDAAPGACLMTRVLIALTVCVLLSATALAEPAITSVAVYPTDVNLTGKQARQAMVVVATREDGVTLDVTKDS